MNDEQKNDLFFEELGRLLRDRRESPDIDLSLEQVARDSDCGLSRSALSLIELGEQQINARQLFEVCKTLKLSADLLFQKVNEKILAEEHPEIKKML